MPEAFDIKANPQGLHSLFERDKESRIERFLQIKEKKQRKRADREGLSFQEQL
jgi:hypothetical protein